MTGVIWFVQVVHYPLFSRVGSEAFKDYEALHTTLTTSVVIVPMLIELLTALWLCFERPHAVSAVEAIVGLVMLSLIWLSTALLQVPKHTQLSYGFNAAVHQSLVATNWLRTVLWSLRSVWLSWLMLKMVR
ncbi:MAG: hypothetical protein RMI34_06395 [Chloroherpetonaceae bacterium]|nr:hypothetical protein [Chloroherpetonaceae bacterium]MCS7211268.1 hypothetical protein [Chloroherpetonaceae bacterium]MDW8019688.1 hypothetical protein [Chloroherpetonaceae bacterium]